MNTQPKLFITALFFIGSVSTSSAMTLTPLERVGDPVTSINRIGDPSATSAELKTDVYFWEGVPYFHGEILADAEVKNNFSFDLITGSRITNSITLTWDITLKLGGDSSAYNDVWVKFVPGTEGPNHYDLWAQTVFRSEATDHYEVKLKMNEEGSAPVTLVELSETRTANLLPDGTTGFDDRNPIYLDTVHLPGHYLGGTIFHITGSATALVDTHAWGTLVSIFPPFTLPGIASGRVGSSLTFEAYATPVPEPEAWAMMLVGGLLVAWQARRRVRKHLQADVPLLGYIPS
ncbi:PEP-CTERM sorting domain-containing protein [Nitrosomonas sp. wSCUT-2]